MKSSKGRSMGLSNQQNTDLKALVFSVQHFCLHDGPGIRSTIFFKGCPLRCSWCQNLESWSKKPEIAFKQHLCIGCRTCVDSCPEQALSDPGYRNPDKCVLCFTCVEECSSTAVVRFGDLRSVGSILDELQPEFPYYLNSKGGVTFSGGEPTLYPEFLVKLTEELQNKGVHVSMETCGHFSFNEKAIDDINTGVSSKTSKAGLKKLLSIIDLVIFDLKLFDDEEHKQYCGTDNRQIKENFTALAKNKSTQNKPGIWPRLPIIPGITDSRHNLLNWSDFLLENQIPFLTLVPYHKMGESKRSWLNTKPGPDLSPVSDELLKAAQNILESRGITCYTPGEEDWTLI